MHDILQRSKKEAARLLIKDIKNNPDLWEWRNPDTRTSIKHIWYGINIRTADYAAHIYEPGEVKFGWVDWWRLRSAIRYWRKTTGKQLSQTYQSNVCITVQQKYLGNPVDKNLLDEKHFVKRVGD